VLLNAESRQVRYEADIVNQSFFLDVYSQHKASDTRERAGSMPWLIEPLNRFDLLILGTNRRIPAILSVHLYALDKGFKAAILICISILARPMETTKRRNDEGQASLHQRANAYSLYLPWEGTTDLWQQIRVRVHLSDDKGAVRSCVRGLSQAPNSATPLEPDHNQRGIH
jgi:hypothetical protein